MSDDKYKDSGWDIYQKLVLGELERHSDDMEHIKVSISKVQIEIAKLQVKSGIWGMLGGLIPVIVMILAEKMK